MIKYSVVLLYLFAFCLYSCKEEETVIKAYLINDSNHNIEILFYKSGVVNLGDTLSLMPNEELLFAHMSHRGDVQIPMFGNKHIGLESDSILVVFDNSFKVTHYYTILPAALAEKHYLRESLRNIINPYSYEFTHKKRGRGRYLNIHKYYFTESDYEFAKD